MRKNIILLSFLIFLSFTANAQQWLWGAQGTSESDTWGVAADNKGNGFLTGLFTDTISFGKFHLKSNTGDMYLVKYDSNGNVVWANQSLSLTKNSACGGFSIATDLNDNIYMSGDFNDSVSFGSDTLISKSRDTYLVKYDAKGNVIWARHSVCLSGSFSFGSSSLAIDASGNICIVGSFSGKLSFGAYSVNTPMYAGQMYLVKYDSNGNVLWAKQPAYMPNTTYSSNLFYLATDRFNNIYITGTLNDTIVFGSDTLTNHFSTYDVTKSEALLVKYDKNGNVLWAKQSQGHTIYSFGQGNSVVVDAFDNAYIVGSYQDTVSFANKILKSGQDYLYLFLVKYDSSGHVIWAKQTEARNWSDIAGYSLAIDKYNQMYLSGGGTYADSVVYGTDSFFIANATATDPSIVMKLDTSGAVLCSAIIRTGGDDANGIVCSPNGRYVYLGGDIFDTITFNHNILNNYSATEPPFIARWLACNPNPESINEIKLNSTVVSLYPNPNNGRFTIGLVNNNMSVIDVYNSLGEKIYSANIQYPQDDVQIDLHSQPAGIYLYRAMKANGTEQFSGKFIIQ